MRKILPPLLRITRLTGRVLRWLLLAIGLLWALGLFIYQPVCLVSVPVALAAWWWVLRRRIEWALWCIFALGAVAYLLLPGPQPDKWQASWERAPQFTLDGDSLTVHNLRDFRYRTEQDFDCNWRTEIYNLSQITGADFAECHWDGMEAICHTMLSFSFADGKHLVISAETRLPEGEEQNAIGGLYKRYGLLYLFGTEEDIFALRTNYRHEDLLLMPLNVTPQTARAMLLHLVQLAQQTEQRHTAYNTLSNNCSSGVMSTFRHVTPGMPAIYNLAPVHNGSISRLLYRHGGFITRPGESYNDLRKRCYLRYDIAPGEPQKYSAAIRAAISR